MGKQRPQVYTYISTEGITDTEITRGDVELIFVNWEMADECYGDYTDEDRAAARAALERIADESLRTTELESWDELIARQKRWEREAEEQAEAAKARRIEEARKTLRDYGELA